MSVRCTWPQPCRNQTTDPSGRCWYHRGSRNPPPPVPSTARLGEPPPTSVVPQIPVIYGPSTSIQLPSGNEYDTAPAEGSACIEYGDGSVCWVLDRQLHREDGPAKVNADGSQLWFIHGKRHRDDGPGVIMGNGSHSWYINDQLHREDGPALMGVYIGQEWWVQDNSEGNPAVSSTNWRPEWWVHDQEIPAQRAQELIEQGVSLLWHNWDDFLRKQLVQDEVDVVKANAARECGLITYEGLRRHLIDGVPLEWCLAWERSQ